MYLTFLNHQWKEFWRSRNKAGSIVAKILLGFFILYFLVVAIAVGFLMKELIADIFPKENPIQIFNGFILYYFMFDFLLRLQFQVLPAVSIVPYLHLNINKNRIVSFLNLKALLSVFNFIPLIIFLPFCFTVIAKTSGTFASIMYAVSIFSLSIFNNYLVLYLKRKSISNILYILTGIAIIASFAAMEYFKIISISDGANWVFNNIAKQPYSGFLFTIFSILIFIVNSNHLRSNLYVEEIQKKVKEKGATDYPFLNRFGKVGELAALELKLIMRHKRSRSTVMLGFIILFYGLFIFKAPAFAKNEFNIPLTIAILITGITSIGYGQYMFGWQSAHFDGILSNKINFKNFIKAKFLLFTISSTVITLLSFFYGFMSWKLIPIFFAAYLYNIGVGSVMILFFATLKYKRLDLSKSATFNHQGTSAIQYLMVFPIILLPLGIYWLFNFFQNPFLGIAALAIFGFINLLMRNIWVNLLTKKFNKQRYKIAAGFRE